MEKSLASEPGKFVGLEMDLVKEETIHNVFDYIENNLGGVGILVNMGSTATGEALIEDMIEAWHWVAQV